MKTRLLVAVIVAVALATGVGLSALPADAQKRTLVVTLLGGDTFVVTVDVPRGTPLDEIVIPDVDRPIIDVREPYPPKPEAAGKAHTDSPDRAGKPKPSEGDKPSGDVDEPSAPADATVSPSAGPTGAGIEPGASAAAPDESAHSDARKPKPAKPRPEAEAHPGRQQRKPKPEADGGVPTPANPTFSLAEPGPAAIGVPNFFIDRFRIPPFLLPIYQAAGIEYDVPWQVLAAINEIETDYGRNLNVSTAGAVGWMQFLPSTWKRYGVDANSDKRKDPYNPVDAIFGAARYLRAAGGEKDLKRAIFAYNHADWYVESVLLRARLIGGLPADLLGSLTGLTQGRFPVAARAKYANDVDPEAATKRVAAGNAALPVESDARRSGIEIFARRGAPVVAVQDGRVVALGTSKRLGRYVVLEDVYGNRYTYGRLGRVSRWYATPKEKKVSARSIRRELALPKADPAPTVPASAGVQKAERRKPAASRRAQARAAEAARVATDTRASKERLFAHPARPVPLVHGGSRQIKASPRFTTFKDYFSVPLELKRSDVVLKRLEPGARVIAGSILGRIGKTVPALAPHLYFEIRPAGRGAPRIDPKPILDGWKLLEATAIYRAANKNPFFGPDAKNPSVGQVLLMSKSALERRVLADPNVQLYDCGRRDIGAGIIDRRVLATLEFLAVSGLKPTVTSLNCGHSYLTKSGNVSEHSAGSAVDIARVNNIPIFGHQGDGSITDLTIRRLLTLQGTMRPHQIISLMTYRGADNTLSLPDHADHIHVGFRPQFAQGSKLGRKVAQILKPGQWIKLVDRLSEIPNPTVRVAPSKYSVRVRGRHGSGD